jgi:hypothetical protein
MATIDQIRNAKHMVPFRPFTVHLVDGRAFSVQHPDFIALPTTPRGRDLTVHQDDGPHWIDINLVVSVHPEPAPANMGGDEN